MTSASDQGFGEPVPRDQPAVYKEFEWPADGVIPLQPGPASLSVNIAEVLQARHSARSFARLQPEQLAALFWLSARTHSRRNSPFGFQQQFRPHPSAGAMHPIHVLCQQAAGEPWQRYDPVAHALIAVAGTRQLADAAREKALELLPVGEATVLALVAEPGKTRAKYENPESLVWRDAGVVLGYLSLVAATLNLASCPLGHTGGEFIEPLAPGILEGVGLAAVGARQSESD